MRILYVGELAPHTRCAQRARALVAQGHHLTALSLVRESFDGRPTRLSLAERIAWRLRHPLDGIGINQRLLEELSLAPYDLLWVETGRQLRPGTLGAARRLAPATRQLLFSEDDLALEHNRSAYLDEAIGAYDLVVTTKQRNLLEDELAALGARRVHYEPKTFDPCFHRPIEVGPADRSRFGAPVCFVGTYEEPRAESCIRLAEAGLEVRVFGNGWERQKSSSPKLVLERRPLVGEDYVRAIRASDLSLGFLRRANRDQHTDRSVEIPACQGVLLAERSAEHQALFREGEHALYFESDQELVETARRALLDPEGLVRLALAGRQRCLELDLSHGGAVERVLRVLFREGVPGKDAAGRRSVPEAA